VVRPQVSNLQRHRRVQPRGPAHRCGHRVARGEGDPGVELTGCGSGCSAVDPAGQRPGVHRPYTGPVGRIKGHCPQSHPARKTNAERLCRAIRQDLPHRGAGLLCVRFTAGGQRHDCRLTAPMQPPPAALPAGPHPTRRISCETIPQPLLLTGSGNRGCFNFLFYLYAVFFINFNCNKLRDIVGVLIFPPLPARAMARQRPIATIAPAHNGKQHESLCALTSGSQPVGL